jgi:hypothetical protein
MVMMRLGFVLGVTLATLVGCAVGAPNRAGNIQNSNAIRDDISAVKMTEPDAQKVHDPNLPTTLPNHYELPPD